MLERHTTPFDRIFTHRLDAASQYLHDKEQTRQFTDTIQGNELSPSQLETLHKKTELHRSSSLKYTWAQDRSPTAHHLPLV